VILIPCNKTITAEGTAKLLLDNLYKRFGLPDKFISDRDPRFASKTFLELLKLLGITSALSMAFHPQTDGTPERVNQEIEAYLSISPFIAPPTQKTGSTHYQLWNSSVITKDMPID
jgi:transposase InsO family protein